MTEDQEDDVILMLTDGLGVENIALRLGINPDQVRAFVQQLRDEGALAWIYGGDDEN